MAQYKTFAVNMPLIFASSHFIIIVYIYRIPYTDSRFMYSFLQNRHSNTNNK